MARQYRTNKRIPEGTTKAVIASLIREIVGDDGMQKVALILRLEHISSVYAIQEKGSMSLDDAATLSLAGGTAAAEYLAALAGGQFIPVEPIDEPLEALVSRFAKENSDVIQAAIAMLTRGDHSCGVLASEIDDAIRVLIAARRACTPNKKDRP